MLFVNQLLVGGSDRFPRSSTLGPGTCCNCGLQFAQRASQCCQRLRVVDEEQTQNGVRETQVKVRRKSTPPTIAISGSSITAITIRIPAENPPATPRHSRPLRRRRRGYSGPLRGPVGRPLLPARSSFLAVVSISISLCAVPYLDWGGRSVPGLGVVLVLDLGLLAAWIQGAPGDAVADAEPLAGQPHVYGAAALGAEAAAGYGLWVAAVGREDGNFYGESRGVGTKAARAGGVVGVRVCVDGVGGAGPIMAKLDNREARCLQPAGVCVLMWVLWAIAIVGSRVVCDDGWSEEATPALEDGLGCRDTSTHNRMRTRRTLVNIPQ
ncbi:hypothetical protein Pelo_16694 [Pelomyxa schiedti]|nr:hypothetical protein Pelo_16694 [Pelomyxa schiedti]